MSVVLLLAAFSFTLVARELDPVGVVLVLLLIAVYLAFAPRTAKRNGKPDREYRREFRG